MMMALTMALVGETVPKEKLDLVGEDGAHHLQASGQRHLERITLDLRGHRAEQR